MPERTPMSQRLSMWTVLTLSAMCGAVSCSSDDDDSDPSASGAGGEAGAMGGEAGATGGGGEVATPPDGGAGLGGISGAGAGGAGGHAAGNSPGGAEQGGQSGAGGEQGGNGGEGGASPPNVVLDATDGTLRSALGETAPRALYFSGRDLPAGPLSAATSACADACLANWAIFHASPLVVAPPLDAEDFGELVRPDGALQTTFKGWPLYLYAAEPDATSHAGDGVDQLWHTAQQPFYSLVIMKSQASPEQPAYLADAAGRTIYELLGDTAGSAGADPISTCTTAGCRRAWPVVSLGTAKVVSSIGGAIDIFIRPEGHEFQLSYRGLPIYYYNNDKLPGDLLGITKTSWVLAVP